MTHLQMPQLPRARSDNNDNLCHAVPHCTRVGRLAQVSEVRLAFTLVLLLAADVFELLIEVAQLRRQFAHVRPVVLAVRLRAANNYVEVQSDV